MAQRKGATGWDEGALLSECANRNYGPVKNLAPYIAACEKLVKAAAMKISKSKPDESSARWIQSWFQNPAAYRPEIEAELKNTWLTNQQQQLERANGHSAQRAPGERATIPQTVTEAITRRVKAQQDKVWLSKLLQSCPKTVRRPCQAELRQLQKAMGTYFTSNPNLGSNPVSDPLASYPVRTLGDILGKPEQQARQEVYDMMRQYQEKAVNLKQQARLEQQQQVVRQQQLQRQQAAQRLAAKRLQTAQRQNPGRLQNLQQREKQLTGGLPGRGKEAITQKKARREVMAEFDRLRESAKQSRIEQEWRQHKRETSSPVAEPRTKAASKCVSITVGFVVLALGFVVMAVGAGKLSKSSKTNQKALDTMMGLVAFAAVICHLMLGMFFRSICCDGTTADEMTNELLTEERTRRLYKNPYQLGPPTVCRRAAEGNYLWVVALSLFVSLIVFGIGFSQGKVMKELGGFQWADKVYMIIVGILVMVLPWALLIFLARKKCSKGWQWVMIFLSLISAFGALILGCATGMRTAKHSSEHHSPSTAPTSTSTPSTAKSSNKWGSMVWGGVIVALLGAIFVGWVRANCRMVMCSTHMPVKISTLKEFGVLVLIALVCLMTPYLIIKYA